MQSAVLVIDVQRGLFDEIPRPYEAEEIIGRINSITGRARKAKVPVIFIQHEQAKGLLAWASDGWKLQAGLIVAGDDYRVRKKTPDSFLGTDLHQILEANNVDDVIICGYASEFCIDTTTRRAAALGYTVQLVADGHTTHDKGHASAKQIREHHNQTLQDIASFGPSITAVGAADIIFGTDRTKYM
jgi:nicotinamidase-related amidase